VTGNTTIELRKAVADVVALVNRHSGGASVMLRFNSTEVPPLDYVANSASFQGDRFFFSSGFETFDGCIEELADIHAEVIGR
jgi:hypothetical protein